MSTKPPTVGEFLDAAAATYSRSVPSDLQPFTDAAGNQITSIVDAEGFYGEAFIDQDGNIIVAYEGTSDNNLLYAAGTALVDADLAADVLDPLSEFFPVLPALSDAADLITQVNDALALRGGSNLIYVTGHSLGGTEAEYAASVSPGVVGGMTFGATGLPGYIGIGGEFNSSTFVDYVESRDPIGNTDSLWMQHYGTVDTIGSSGLPSLDYHHLTQYATDLALPDLEIDSLTPLTATVSKGDSISVGTVVHNDGTGYAGAFTTSIYISPDATYDANAVLLTTFLTDSLAAGAKTGDLTATVTVPSTIPSGNDYLIVIADDNDPTNTLGDINPDNNSYSIPIVVESNPIVIYTVTDLQNIKDNLAGDYVLGNDIDASGFSFISVGDITNPFTGIFDGRGHSIKNLSVSSSTDYDGLFGAIAAGGTVRNTKLTGATVHGGSNSSTGAGLLSGSNAGTITECSVTGVVSNGGVVGGLVGINTGTITACSASGTASSAIWPGPAVGGLVGSSSGTISESFASVAVSGKIQASLGGLVGATHGGTINECYATGQVNLGESGDVALSGGLVGFDGFVGDLTVVDSYWDTGSTGQTTSVGGVGVTTEELQSGTLPVGFDSTVWNATSGDYPGLVWQGATAPTVTEALVSDTGSSSTDKITSNLGVTGTADPSATVTIKEGTTILGTTVADGTGVWTLNPTLADGPHTLVASETNLANNTGFASLTFTLDTTAPLKPTGLTLASASDSGVQFDNITDVRAPVITGTGEAGDTVTLFDGSESIGTGAVLSDGRWSVTTTALPPGVHFFTAAESDIAGNVSVASSSLALTISQLPQNDYNGDGTGDVLFQNDQTGQLRFVEMKAGASVGTGLATGGVPGLVFGGDGDINGDGYTDIVEQDPGSGRIFVGYQNGSGVPNWAALPDATPGWNVDGVADINGDGYADIVVENQTTDVVDYYDVRNAKWNAVATVPGFNVVGLGDINGDGNADIVIENPTTGQIEYFDVAKGVFTGVASTPGWSVRAVGDLTGDGYADIVVQSQSTGQTAFADMHGGSFSGWSTATTGLTTDYKVTGAVDVNNDGFADVIVQQQSTGATYYAQEGASGFVQWGLVPNGLGTHGHVV